MEGERMIDPKFLIEPSGQFTPDGEAMLNMFYEGECVAANILENEIEPIYYQYILEHTTEEEEESVW